MTERIVVLERRPTGQVDRYGEPISVWLDGPVLQVLFAPGTSVEGNEAIRTAVDTAATLYLEPGAPRLEAGARVRDERRVVWDVDGDPAVWSDGVMTAGSTVKLTRGAG